MSHKSRLSTVVIDCHTHLDQAARFWSAALQRKIVSHDQDGDGLYGELESGPGEVFVLLQRVTHEARVHLDIQADDQDAEVARLEALGAKKVAFKKRWWVLEAPTGHRFCVVRQQSEKPQLAPNTWGRRA